MSRWKRIPSVGRSSSRLAHSVKSNRFFFGERSFVPRYESFVSTTLLSLTFGVVTQHPRHVSRRIQKRPEFEKRRSMVPRTLGAMVHDVLRRVKCKLNPGGIRTGWISINVEETEMKPARPDPLSKTYSTPVVARVNPRPGSSRVDEYSSNGVYPVWFFSGDGWIEVRAWFRPIVPRTRIISDRGRVHVPRAYRRTTGNVSLGAPRVREYSEERERNGMHPASRVTLRWTPRDGESRLAAKRNPECIACVCPPREGNPPLPPTCPGERCAQLRGRKSCTTVQDQGERGRRRRN